MKLKLFLILSQLVLGSVTSTRGSCHQAGDRLFDDQSQNRAPVDWPGGRIFSEIRSGPNVSLCPQHADPDRQFEDRQHAHRLRRSRRHPWSLGR